jgi:transcriptional regulator GlxA family with amidase domain
MTTILHRRRTVRYRYPNSKMRQACELLLTHPPLDVALMTGIARSTVYRWKEKLRDPGPGPRTVEQSERAVYGIDRRAEVRRATSEISAELIQANVTIRDRFNSPLDCRALAKNAGVSLFHFIRSYKAAYGVTPYRHITELRVAEAARLLRDATLRADVIATAVGFSSYAVLTRAFKSVNGIAVSEYCETFNR